MGKLAEGIQELEQALHIMDDIGDEVMLPMTLISLGQTYAASNNKERALHTLERARIVLEKYQSDPRIGGLQGPLQQLLDYVRGLPSDS
jgi:hypothetical protein